MEGMYRTRSATTKPTGKKRLEAGRKGMRVQARARRRGSAAKWCGVRSRPTRAVCRSRALAARVNRFRGSVHIQGIMKLKSSVKSGNFVTFPA